MGSNNLFLSDNQTGERYGVTRVTVWRWVKNNPEFSKPVKFSPGCVRWSISELQEYETRQAEASQG